eukprot:455410_1
MSHVVDFIDMRNVDQFTLYIVTCYVKEMEKLLQTNYPSLNMGSLVLYLIILYVSTIERFIRFPKDIKTNQNKDFVQIDKVSGKQTAHGFMTIDGSIDIVFCWEWKIIRCGLNNIRFGLTSTNNIQDQGISFCYDNDGMIYSTYKDYNWHHKYGTIAVSGHTIKMILNIPNKTIEFYINNVHYGIAFTNIAFKDNGKDIQYHMFVFMSSSSDCVQLKGFHMSCVS